MLYLIGVTRDAQNKPLLRAILVSDDTHLGELAKNFSNGRTAVSLGKVEIHTDEHGGLYSMESYHGAETTNAFDKAVIRETLFPGLDEHYDHTALLVEAYSVLERRHDDPKDVLNHLLEDALIHYQPFDGRMVRDGVLVFSAQDQKV